MSNETELKPCPKCLGTNIRLRSIKAWGSCWFGCIDCGHFGSDERTPREARDKWNNRTIEDQLRAEIERLKEEIEKVNGILCDARIELASIIEHQEEQIERMKAEIATLREEPES
jgi:hypothetical protein